MNNTNYDLSQLPDQYSQIALLLPLTGPLSGPGQAIRDGFFAGYYNSIQEGRQMIIKVYDSNSGNINNLYQQAINEGANLVVGPLSKDNVKALARDSITVPTLALNYTDPGYQPAGPFFEFGISPLNEANQIARQTRNDNREKALVIAPESDWGQNIASAFTSQFQQMGGKIIDSFYYSPDDNLRQSIKQLLQVDRSQARAQQIEKIIGAKVTFVPHRRQDMDMIFLVAKPDMARQIVPLLKFYYAGNIPIYSISMIYGGKPNTVYYQDMDGVTFTDIPALYNGNLKGNLPRLYALGLDAFTLTQNLKNLSNSPAYGIKGNSGLLFIGPNNWILQQYQLVKFVNGTAS